MHKLLINWQLGYVLIASHGILLDVVTYQCRNIDFLRKKQKSFGNLYKYALMCPGHGTYNAESFV